MFDAWNVAKGRKVQGGRILSQGIVFNVYIYPHLPIDVFRFCIVQGSFTKETFSLNMTSLLK